MGDSEMKDTGGFRDPGMIASDFGRDNGAPSPSHERDRLLAALRAAEAERDRMREAAMNAIPALAAAISLLENGGKKAAASDKMFAQMLDDYRKHLTIARAALSTSASKEGE